MSKEIRAYKEVVMNAFDSIEKEYPQLKKAADLMAEAIIANDVIHVIGTGGHSSMAAEEVFWRAGGLVPMNAMLDAGLNVIHGAKRSNIMERLPGYGVAILDSYGAGKKPGEVIIVVNAYGINSTTIDVAMEAKKRGMKVIAITSRSFADNVPAGAKSRHPSNQNLYQIADVFINCNLPYGDAVVEVEGVAQKVAPTSTLCNSFTINCLVIETVKSIVEKGGTPPLWVSANLPGGDESNKSYEEEYFGRIKHLR